MNVSETGSIENVLSKYENNIDNIFDKGTLQFYCIKSLIINGNIKLNKLEDLHLPPILRNFFKNYNKYLVCKICSEATWDLKHRTRHMPQDQINELYDAIDELNSFISPSKKLFKNEIVRPKSCH